MNASEHPPGSPAPRTDPVDWDLLADYTGGALDGTPEAAQVAGRIATDPAWAGAHQRLVAADVVVHSRLAALADETEPAPPDLLSRLDLALAVGAPAGASSPAEPAAPAPPPDSQGGAAAGAGNVRPLRPRRMSPRQARLIGVAAAVVTVAGVAGVLGVTNLAGDGRDHRNATPVLTNGTGTTGREPALGPNNRPYGVEVSPNLLLASGTDYRPDNLATLLHHRGRSGASLAPTDRTRVPAELSRLTAPDALTGCLTALRAIVPGTPAVVDYARFQGRPALVLAVPTDQPDRPWIVVAGPGCGRTGADLRYRTRPAG